MPTTTNRQPETPAEGLAAVVELRRLADRLEASEVERALRQGWSWSRIAEALGVTPLAEHPEVRRTRPGGRHRNQEETRCLNGSARTPASSSWTP